ncbi:MAG: hypothetical protein NDJ94_17140 [Vicinamibacteria bacterium]|nr:hypothetical protein [Vicinamibacteria bacterium]
METSTNAVSAGFNLRPSPKFDAAVTFSWMDAAQALDPFTMPITPAFAAAVPLMPYDYTQTWSYSDLDVQRLDAAVSAHYKLSSRASLRGEYRYVDYADDAPYLEDTSGRNHVVSLAVGFLF